jgi:DNA-binding transcriptional ArsR family regulator
LTESKCGGIIYIGTTRYSENMEEKKLNQDELVRIFKSLANENRLKILEAIKNSQAQCTCCPEDVSLFNGEEGTICCVDEIVGQFNMAQSTISQHLKELYNSGLLERHKKAQWVYYTVNQKKLEELAEYLRSFAVALSQKK